MMQDHDKSEGIIFEHEAIDPRDGLSVKAIATGRTIPDTPRACLLFRTEYETDLLYIDQVVNLRDALSKWIDSVSLKETT
jgi:hypothetical protein